MVSPLSIRQHLPIKQLFKIGDKLKGDGVVLEQRLECLVLSTQQGAGCENLIRPVLEKLR